MQVNNAEDVVKFLLRSHPVANSAEIVAQVDIASRLYTRKNALFYLCAISNFGRFHINRLTQFNRHQYLPPSTYFLKREGKEKNNKKRHSPNKGTRGVKLSWYHPDSDCPCSSLEQAIPHCRIRWMC